MLLQPIHKLFQYLLNKRLEEGFQRGVGTHTRHYEAGS